MTPGSKWVSHTMQWFEVVRIEHDWVFYRRQKDGAEFSCLQSAFVQRFSPIINI